MPQELVASGRLLTKPMPTVGTRKLKGRIAYFPSKQPQTLPIIALSPRATCDQRSVHDACCRNATSLFSERHNVAWHVARGIGVPPIAWHWRPANVS